MNVRSFFDTNILVYSDDEDEPRKRGIAMGLLKQHGRQRSGVVSLQVLQEYFVTVTKKLKMEATRAKGKVELLAALDVVAPDLRDILAAIDLHRLHGFSYWDALVIQTAKQGGCSVVYSEDWQHGQQIDGIRVINPFV